MSEFSGYPSAPRGVPPGEVPGRHTAQRAAQRASRDGSSIGEAGIIPVSGQYKDPAEVGSFLKPPSFSSQIALLFGGEFPDLIPRTRALYEV
jgi:hypothetical protein